MLNNVPEIISTVQIIEMIITSNMTISYFIKDVKRNDPMAKIKLMTKIHFIARSSLPPLKTVAVKRKAIFIIKYPRDSRATKIP